MNTKCLSSDEYISLRDEIKERISIMNTQASSAVGIILTIWAAGISLLAIELGGNTDLNVDVRAFLAILESLIFLMAELVLVPMALKSGENIRQIVSLGTYIQVFYEYVSLGNDAQCIYYWETADKYLNSILNYNDTNEMDRNNPLIRFIGRLRFRNLLYNSEYTILGALSSIFIFCVYVYDWHILKSAHLHVIFAIGCVCVVAFSLFLLGEIYKHSSSNKNIWNIKKRYLKTYLILAKEMGFIDEDDLSVAYSRLSIKNKPDIESYQNLFTD